MKKLVLILLLIITITGCNSKEIRNENSNQPEEEKVYEGDTTSDIVMTIKEGTLTNHSATIIIKELSNKDYIYGYGEDYSLCKKKGNNWIYVPIKLEGNVIIPDIGYGIIEQGLLEFDLNFITMWDELEPGEYKIVKSASLAGENVKYYFSTDFTID